MTIISTPITLLSLIGATNELDADKDTNFSLGIDYVRRFSNDGRWGIGVFGEAIFAEHTDWLFGVPFYFYPTNNFWLRAGPALEIHKKDKKSNSETTSSSTTETGTEFVIRTGIGYDIELGGFTIAPTLSFDFLRDGTTLVWGINLGKGF